MLQILGEHADWVTFYKGSDRKFVLDKLPRELLLQDPDVTAPSSPCALSSALPGQPLRRPRCTAPGPRAVAIATARS